MGDIDIKGPQDMWGGIGCLFTSIGIAILLLVVRHSDAIVAWIVKH